MNLTRKFWIWFGQVLTLTVFILRIDLVVRAFKLLPFADSSQLFCLFFPLFLAVAIWATWLTWRAYIGFFRAMDFLIDDAGYRW